MRKLRRYKDKQKIQARDAVSNAIKRGELPKAQTCQCVYCGQPATTYHHHNGYRKEHFLDVVPVCDKYLSKSNRVLSQCRNTQKQLLGYLPATKRPLSMRIKRI